MPGVSHRHEERADATAANTGLCRREDDQQFGGLGVRDPYLAAVDHVAPVVEARHRLLVRRVRAGVLFGERERAERLPDARRRSHGLLLRSEPNAASGSATSELLTAGDHRDDRAGAGERLDRECVADVIAGPPRPILDGIVTPSSPSAAASRIKRFGKHSLFVNRRCRRVDPRRGKLADPILKLPLGVGQFEVHRAIVTSEMCVNLVP